MAPARPLPKKKGLPQLGANGPPASSLEQWKRWALAEWQEPQKRASNLVLLRCAALFFGSVAVMRNCGEMFSI